MSEFLMPSLGADMEEGTVLEWRVGPGDVVQRGDIVLLVDTEKAEIEVEIWEAGVVEELLVPVGKQVPVGTPLARLRGGDEAPGVSSAAPSRAVVEEVAPVAQAAQPAPAPRVSTSERIRASPLARTLAEARGVDLASVRGTGMGGAITREDVERSCADAEAPLVETVRAETRPEAPDRLASMRRAIAGAMARSKREIPHYYLETTIDLQPAMRWLSAANERRDVTQRLLPSVLLLKATALALAQVPELNGHFVEGVFHPVAARHVGMAIAMRGGGLLAPAIHDVDQRDLDSLMSALRDLVARTRAGKLRSSEVSDATVTVTSLGDLGVEKVYGVIYPPQVALVGFGRITERPWACEGMLGIRPVVSATLAADHRVSDGARGAKFLGALADWLARPEQL